MASHLPTWPPPVSSDHLSALTVLATTYALSHGLLYLPVPSSHRTRSPPSAAPTSAIHAPLALFPSPFPRHLFDLARRLQRIYNVLYARIALDNDFLDQVMGVEQGVGAVDEFTGQLWKIWRSVREDGFVQPLQLGIFRSDYLLHAPEKSANPIAIKQVEFNTISSSFGALSERISTLHKHLLSSTQYFNASPYLAPENLPPNRTTSTIAEGLAAAHKAYGVPEAKILFVVQPGERNVFDQRWVEYELLEKHSIHVIRRTLEELQQTAAIDVPSQGLRLSSISSAAIPSGGDTVEISTIYFRAGYTPTDYPNPAYYGTRMLLERSRAIKCPSIALQLAGGKKVQQVLTQPGVLESFLLDPTRGEEKFTQKDVDDVRASWVEMWGLADGGSSGFENAYNRHMNLVLKPQREGGGNNVYKSSIPSFLHTLPPSEREAWIVMQLIQPPKAMGNWLVRAGGAAEGAFPSDVVSELGIFGWALFGDFEETGNSGTIFAQEKETGWLLRTKGTDSDEGGVAAGFSVLDSLLLIDMEDT